MLRGNFYPWTLVVAFVLFVQSSVKGEIRCYCNQASCVTTGYMCKSPADLCFSDPQKGVHGCLLDRLSCADRFCCGEDMCNYAPYHHPAAEELEENSDASERISLTEAAVSREVWFRAAVIAVPVAGCFVLVLLIIAAVKILRQDAILRQRRLAELRRIYGHSLRASLLPWSKDKSTSIV